MKYLSLSSDEKNRPRTYANGYLIADKAAYAAAEKVFRKPAEPKPPKRIKTRTIVLLILWSALVVGLIVLGTVGKFDLPPHYRHARNVFQPFRCHDFVADFIFPSAESG